MILLPACVRTLLAGALAMTLGLPAQADQLYRCRSYGGGLFWSQTHCQQHGALIDRIESVPSGLSPDRQIRVAEQGIAKSGRAEKRTDRAASRADGMTRVEQQAQQREARARERHKTRCDRLQAELELQQGRKPPTAYQQQRARERQQRLLEQRSLAGC